MIEYFLALINIVALFNKFNDGATYSFLDELLSPFGILIKVSTSQRHRFLSEFQALYKQRMIDHHTPSKGHLKGDRLAKCLIQVVKKKT